MFIILAFLAVIALAGIIYLFISPKSTGLQKKAALVALILSGAALFICGTIVVLNLTKKEKDPYAFPLVIEEAEAAAKSNIFELIVFLVLLLVLFAFILFVGLRERKKH